MSSQTTISRHGHVDATPGQILSLVGNTEGFTSINPHKTADPKLQIIPVGPTTGVGSGFSFRGKGGKGTQTVASVADTFVDYAIDMGTMGRSTQRITALPVPDGGCDVEWTMTLHAGRNPMLRIFGLMAGRILGPTLETGIRNLADRTWR